MKFTYDTAFLILTVSSVNNIQVYFCLRYSGLVWERLVVFAMSIRFNQNEYLKVAKTRHRNACQYDRISNGTALSSL